MFSRAAILLAFTVIYTSGANTRTDDRKCGMWKEGGVVKNDSLDASKQAGLGEFPWTVALIKDKMILCTGSLIQSNVVLTAGRCVKDSTRSLRKEDIKVKAGLWDLSNQNDQYPVQERMVSQIINHPEYLKENKTIKNDIALIVLDKSVNFADHISLVCLANKEHEEKSKKCYAAGWGKYNKDEKNPSILKKLHLPIVAKDDCEKKLKDKAQAVTLTDKTICAGGDKAATCMEDAGSALVCQIEPEAQNHNRFVQSGITSWGVGCTNELPGVYTNVAKYRQWIDEQINKLGLDTKHYTI